MPCLTVARRPAAAIAAATWMMATTAAAQAPALTPPRLLEAADATYPKELEAEGIEGKVRLELQLDAQGSLVTARVATSSGNAALDAAALEAAQRLRFAPATRGEKPIAAKIHYTYAFAAKTRAPSAASAMPSTATSSVPSSVPAPSAVASSAPSPAPSPSVASPTGEAPPTTLEVVGKRVPREPTRYEITGEEARKVPGTFGDSLRALETLPGVGRPAFGTGQLIIRGSAPADTSVFAGGVFIPTAYHFLIGPSVIPSELIERINYYPGNFGVEYGRALGGVINIDFRSPNRKRFSGVAQLDGIDGRILVESPLGDRTRVLVAARRSWVDAWLLPLLRSVGQSVPITPVYYDYQLLLEHDLSTDAKVKLLVFGSDDRITGESSTPRELAITFARVALQGQLRLPNNGRLQTLLSYGRNDSLNANETLRDDRNITILQARLDLRTRIAPRIWFLGGVDLLHADYAIIFTRRPSASSELEPTVDRYNGSLVRPAAYASMELHPFPWLQFNSGFRFDYAEDTQRLSFDPRASFRATVHTGDFGTVLKGGLGLFQQPPDATQSLAPWGTPNLFSSRALHAGFGAEQHLGPNLYLSIEGFYKYVDKLIYAVADHHNELTGLRYQNTGNGNIYGLEMQLKWNFDRFYGWLSYTLSRSQRRESSSLPMSVYDFDQPHILSAVASVRLGKGWEAGARFRFVSGNPYTQPLGATMSFSNGNYQPVFPEQSNQQRMADFHRLDLRIEKTWDFRDWKLGAYLDVQNVYNYRASEYPAYNYNFSQSGTALGLPILPMLGLRGEL